MEESKSKDSEEPGIPLERLSYSAIVIQARKESNTAVLPAKTKKLIK